MNPEFWAVIGVGVALAVFSCKNSGGTATYRAKLPRIHTATNIDWHYITQSHILKNISSIAP